jgi:membrane protein YqaA with SNARE-associated domain
MITTAAIIGFGCFVVGAAAGGWFGYWFGRWVELQDEIRSIEEKLKRRERETSCQPTP